MGPPRSITQQFDIEWSDRHSAASRRPEGAQIRTCDYVATRQISPPVPPAPQPPIPAMDAATRQERIDIFTHSCAEFGLPLTMQRRAVLEAVLDLDDHPTADGVHELVADRMPEINRATVYRSLETLVGMGIINRLCHPGRVVRYDGRTELHHHLVCLRCTLVLDVDDERLNRLPIPDISQRDFVIKDLRVQLRGYCRSCREKEKKG